MNRYHSLIATGLTIAILLMTTGAAGQVLPEVDEDVASAVVQPVPDSLLAGRLRTIFSNVGDFTSVTVSVTEGVVRLGGMVGHPDGRRQVEDLTSRLQGVVYVINDVEAATDVETRLTPAMAKIQQYWDDFVSQLPVIGVALVVVLLFWIASFFIGRWRRPAEWMGVNPLVWGFVNRLVRGMLVAIGLVLAFDVLGITSLMGAVLGTAGIVGLALGFAFQDIVENYLAGMLLSLRRPFSVNDLVRIGEYEGRIVRMTSRELVLLTFEGNHVRIPNAHVFKNPLTNFTINPRRLFSFDVGIGSLEDLKKAASVGVDALDAMKGVIDDPRPFARVVRLGSSDVTMRFHGWVDQREADFQKVRSEAIRLVKAALDDAGIEMPEPIHRVLTQVLPAQAAPGAPHEMDREQVDVWPDGKLDEQVIAEQSDDENLLT